MRYFSEKPVSYRSLYRISHIAREYRTSTENEQNALLGRIRHHEQHFFSNKIKFCVFMTYVFDDWNLTVTMSLAIKHCIESLSIETLFSTFIWQRKQYRQNIENPLLVLSILGSPNPGIQLQLRSHRCYNVHLKADHEFPRI